jgi:hypothetical protein
MERSNLTKLNEAEGRENGHTEVSNTYAALEDLDSKVEINNVLDSFAENIKISATESLGYYELKKHNT